MSQHGRYFMFNKSNLTRKKSGNAHFLFHKMISIGILNYFSHFKNSELLSYCVIQVSYYLFLIKLIIILQKFISKLGNFLKSLRQIYMLIHFINTTFPAVVLAWGGGTSQGKYLYMSLMYMPHNCLFLFLVF
jgi:hypothetical protein